MSYAASPAELLAARERRQAIIDRATATGHGVTIVVSANVPGARKTREGVRTLVEEMGARIALAGASVTHDDEDALGPWLVARTRGDAFEVKRMCVALEQWEPAARLADLDVYDGAGRQVGRAELGLAPRRCLLCDAAAVDCMRLGRHPLPALIERVDALLADRRG